MSPLIKQLEPDDCIVIANAFERTGWCSHKPLSQFDHYLSEQKAGDREVLVGFCSGDFAGYLTIVWLPQYEPFRAQAIPEVQEFNVLPRFRRQKVGAALMDRAEHEIARQSATAGIGAGMYPDYGNAQRLYVKQGYIPDGRGLTYGGRVLAPMETAVNDDDLVLYFTKKLSA